ncbi:hypothetical protein ACFX12_016450 [Malus domestica]
MKRAAGNSKQSQPANEETRMKFRHESLLQDYLERQKVCGASIIFSQASSAGLVCFLPVADGCWNCFISESNAGTAKDDSEDEVMNLSVASDVCFIITAFTFLLLPYFVMSTWFIWVLIILFCIGGIEEMHNCVLSVILRYI